MFKQKYKFWAGAILVAIILGLINNFFFRDPSTLNRETITVNAPARMQKAFTETLSTLKMGDEYVLDFTNDPNANFVVTEGISNKKGELIAYSPFVAIFPLSKEIYQNYIEKEVFVTSTVDSKEYDFDFKKVIDEVLSASGSDLTIYYPSQNSDYWDEFYAFLLFTVNDGYFPRQGKEMQDAQKMIEDFLNTKNAVPITKTALEKNKGIASNSIYFVTYADLAELYSKSIITSFRIMYPKTVVYHYYYATFDQKGNILYDALSKKHSGILYDYQFTGYSMLSNYAYNTNFTGDTSTFYNSDYATGKRSRYNGVEIPDVNFENLYKEVATDEN